MAGKSLASINIAFTADMTSFSTAMQNGMRDMQKMGKKLQATGKSMSMYLTAPLAALGAVALKSSADLEVLKTSLTTAFEGNKKAADAAFKSIEQFASNTPYALEEVLQGFLKLKNMGLDPSEAALTSYGNTASSMGKSLNDMIEAVADAATGEFERLKEFGIKAKSEGDKVSFTFQGVTTTIGKNSEEIQDYLLDIGNTKFAGGIERQAQTMKGSFSTMMDNLKLLAADFGDIMATAIKPLVKYVTDLAARFRDLDPTTKKVITVVAALVSAIGPLLVILGTLMTTVIPGVITAFSGLTAVMIANPFGAVAAAIGIAITAFKLWNGVTTDALSQIDKEQSELNGLVRAIESTAEGTEMRAKLVDDLNSKYPGFLGNLDKEKVTNEDLKAALAASNSEYERKIVLQGQADEMQKAATNSAEKFTNLYKERLNAAKLINKVEQETGQSIDRNRDLTEQLGEAIRIAKEQDAKDSGLFSFGGSGLWQDLLRTEAAINEATIAYGEASTAVEDLKVHQSELLQEMGYTEQVMNNTAAATDKVTEANKKLSQSTVNLSSKGSGVDQLSPGGDMELQGTSNEGFATTYKAISEAADQAAASARMFGTETEALAVKQQYLEGAINSAISAYGVQSNEVAQLMEMYRELQKQVEMNQAVTQGLNSVFDAMAGSIVSAFGEAETAGERFLQSLVANVLDVIAAFLAQSLAGAVASATQSAAATGPGAVAAMPTFIAGMTGAVLSAFAAIPQFATGAYVTGPTLAMVGEGKQNEFVAPENMLANLIRKNAGGGAITVDGQFTMAGDDMRLTLDRSNYRAKRLGR